MAISPIVPIAFPQSGTNPEPDFFGRPLPLLPARRVSIPLLTIGLAISAAMSPRAPQLKPPVLRERPTGHFPPLAFLSLLFK